MLVGNTVDSDILRGKQIKLNMRIGTLVCSSGKIEFIGNPLQQLISDSREQNDDMMSKMSTMSRMSMFGLRKSSLTQAKNDAKSRLLQQSLMELSPNPKKSTAHISRKKPNPLTEAMGGLRVTVNPITGHTQQFLPNDSRKGSIERSPDANKQDLIDFTPIEVNDIGLASLTKRKKEPVGGFVVPHRSSLKETKGIAELFASVGDKSKNVDEKYFDLISNFDAISITNQDEQQRAATIKPRQQAGSASHRSMSNLRSQRHYQGPNRATSFSSAAQDQLSSTKQVRILGLDQVSHHSSHQSTQNIAQKYATPLMERA